MVVLYRGDMLTVELAPRALRDLKNLPTHHARIILDDLEILRTVPWPGPPKMKFLKGVRYSRLRTGDFRSIVVREGYKVVVLRIVARKDFETILKGLS